MSSAPPLDSSMISWKTPLPKVRAPTTVAAVVVLQRAGDDLRAPRRCRGRRGRPAARRGRRRRRARVQRAVRHGAALGRDDRRPSRRNALATSCASVTARRRCARRSKTIPVGAALRALRSALRDLAVRARAERRQRDDAEPVPSTIVRSARGDDRDGDRARARRSTRPRLAVAQDAQRDLGAGRALDERASRARLLMPASDSSSAAAITSPAGSPRACAGESA